MKSVFKLLNSIQNYAWGSITGISTITGIENPRGIPMAELWMGTHPAAPSYLDTGTTGKPVSLESIVPVPGDEAEPNRRKQRGLPFLFKLLSAAQPLSLQVHPNRQQAQEGFSRENSLGIPITDPRRNYRDPNHKPEIMAALTNFHAMCGFRPVEDTVLLMKMLMIDELDQIINMLASTRDYPAFLENLLAIEPGIINNICRCIGEKTGTNDHSAQFLEALTTSQKLVKFYPEDIGVLSPFYLNLIELSPGEALFLPAGILHAYLEGTGFELMASSDNVLRAGLTPKHIDIKELLSIVVPVPFCPKVIKPEFRDGIAYYPAPSADFQLGFIENRNGTLAYPRPEPSIIICIDGKLRLEIDSADTTELKKGDSCYIAPGSTPVSISGRCCAWFATIPQGLTCE